MLIFYDIEFISLYIFGRRIGTDRERERRRKEIKKRRDTGHKQDIRILRTWIRHNVVKFHNEERSNSRIWHLSLK